MSPLSNSTDAAGGLAALPLLGRRVQIAGSADGRTDPTLISYAHEVVRNLVKGVMAAGSGIVVGIGREPRPDGSAPDAPSLLFDRTALEAAAECLKQGFQAWPVRFGLPIVVASSEKAVSEIPDNRRPLYEELLRRGLLHVESIMPGSRAAAFLRQRQAVFGDALVILGGGTGVEHSADMYLSRRKPVVPLDLALGASRDDGTGGAVKLAKEARTEPTRFFRFSPAFANEKGGKEHEMPVHHLLEQILNEYIEAAGLQSGQSLFQSVNSAGTAVTGRALNRYNAWAAIRKRAKAAGFLTPVGCHTWRATGITIYLENDGRLEHAQQMAGHESPRTTKLYDRTKDEITLSEVERIRL
jgi:TIR- and PNP-associating SLOG family/Phage integrase family